MPHRSISRRAALGALGSSAAVSLLGLEGAARAEADKPAPPLQRGVQLGLFHEDPLWSYAGLLRELRELGTSHVGLTVAYYQDHAASTEIYEHPRFTAPDAALVRTIDEAHGLGLKVMVFPIVRLLKPRSSSEWRGTLRPADPAAWWQSYEQRLLRVGRLCQRAHVAQLSVGSELSTLDVAKERPRWQALIEKVRKGFRGLLTYSGNWDHFEQVGLYDLLDTAGLCAYFPLAEAPVLGPAPTPELPALVTAWRRKRDELEKFAARVGRPLVLTEVGYLSQRGCARKPLVHPLAERALARRELPPDPHLERRVAEAQPEQERRHARGQKAQVHRRRDADEAEVGEHLEHGPQAAYHRADAEQPGQRAERLQPEAQARAQATDPVLVGQRTEQDEDDTTERSQRTLLGLEPARDLMRASPVTTDYSCVIPPLPTRTDGRRRSARRTSSAPVDSEHTGRRK